MSDPLSQIRMRDLMLLEHVHTLGTLRLAAQALHVTQPAITQTLKGLERAFGIALVERGRRGVSLTAAGQAALTRLRCARQEIEQARDAALSVMRPVLRVGATPIASLNLLPLAIGRMRLRMPAARLMLTEAGVASLWQQLSDGGLDALIGRMPAQDSKDAAHGSLRHETIGAERMVVVGRREHPMARPTARRRDRRAWLRSLAASAWVLPPGDALSVLNFNERFSQAGLLPPVPTVVSGSFYASLNMVAKAELLCVVPETAALALKQSLRLSILDVPWLNPPVDIVFAARVSAWDTQALAELRACFGSKKSPACGALVTR